MTMATMNLSLALTLAFFTITTLALPQRSVLNNSTQFKPVNSTLMSADPSFLRSNESRLNSVDRLKSATGKKVCQGPLGDSWYAFRDTAEKNAEDFCGQSEQTKKYNEGTVFELELSATKPGLNPQDSLHCLGRLEEVIENCDSVTNPYNYIVGSTLVTNDGWTYSMTPFSNQLNDASCDVSFHVGFDFFEIRGFNWFESDVNDGMAIQNELQWCGILTHWNFEWTPDDCCFQWYASGWLQNGVKHCVGSAIRSAGASSKSRCH